MSDVPAGSTEPVRVMKAVILTDQAGNTGSAAVIGKVGLDHYVISTATGSNVSSSATAVTLLAANASRKAGSSIVNDSTAILYIKLGSSASATDYWKAIDGKTTIPGDVDLPPGYLGIVTGIWASANGAARIVEMT